MSKITKIVYLLPSSDSVNALRMARAVASRLPEGDWDVRSCILAPGWKASRRSARLAWAPRESSILDHGRGLPLHQRWPIDPFAWLRLRRYLAEHRPVILHAWGPTAWRYGVTAAESAGSGPCLATMPVEEPAARGAMVALDRKLVRQTARWVVPFEQSTGDRAIAELAPGNSVVIPPGVGPAAPVGGSREALLSGLGLAKEARLIGVAGPLVRQGRFKDVLWAAELVYVLHRKSCLLVLGDGPERLALERFALDLNARGRIKFIGDRQSVQAVLPWLDVFWSGSEGSTIPTSLLDAMAAGVPVVTSDTAAHRAVVVDGETGYLAKLGSRTEFAKATDHIYADAELAMRLGQAGQQRADRHFSAAAMAAQYLDLYRQLRM